MSILDIIAKKRDGRELGSNEIAFVAAGAASGALPDYQLAALLMAIRINGMTAQETADLTMAMAETGEIADLSQIGGVVCDKHSTGGVGDSVTLVSMPIAAACGVKIAKMSGRGLGHTGGTIDKLDSIGVSTRLSTARLCALTKENGLAIAQQSGNLAPADKAIYALRDVTATVDSIPLIASSILSKKIATGADAIVLDVKSGSGALMGGAGQAEALAAAITDTAKALNKRVICAITDMSQPLGTYIGNRLEVYESVMALKCLESGRLTEAAVVIASLLISAGLGVGLPQAEKQARAALSDGRALKSLRAFIGAQGGDTSAVDSPESLKKYAPIPVLSVKSGYVYAMRADEIGEAARELGAGRYAKNDVIDFDAGIRMRVSIGDAVKQGDIVAELFAGSPEKTGDAALRVSGAIEIADEKPALPKLVHSILGI